MTIGSVQSGPPRVPLLVIGHSHVACLAAAARERPGAPVEVVNLMSFPRNRPPRTPGGQIDGAALRDVLPQTLCLLLEGNLHNLLGMFEHERPFTVAGEAADSDRTFIPRGTLRAVMAARLAGHLDDARGLLAAWPEARPLIALPPPPVADWGLILAHPHFAARAQAGRSTASHRLALWRLQCEVMTDFAAGCGAAVVGPPADCLDAEGLLARDFALDPTHGNTAYGAAMLDRIRAVTGLAVAA